MSKYRALRAGLPLVILAIVVIGSATAAATRPSTSYTVTFKESGLAAGTNWSVTFNSVTLYSKGSEMNFTGVTTSGYWTTPSTEAGSPATTQYATAWTSGYLAIPYALAQGITFVKEYQVGLAVSPVSTGSTSPYPGTAFYAAGSQIAISATPTTGYGFSKWTSSSAKDTLDSKSHSATVLTINAPATITANFKAQPTKFSFTEVGLPSGTAWSAVFGGVSYGGSTATVSTSTQPVGSYSWTIATLSAPKGVEYVPAPAYGYVYLPQQLSQEIIFTKEFQVAFATTPASSGSTSPSATTYYPNNTALAINAYDGAGYVFQSWSGTASVGILNKNQASTVATINVSTTLTAKFVSGTPCSASCSVTFNEVGLPVGAAWGVNVGGVNYYSNTTSLAITGQSTGFSWYASTYVAGGGGGQVQYSPVTGSGYWSLGASSDQMVVYQKYVYENILTTPGGYGTGTTINTGWYLAGAPYAISTANGPQVKFHSWTTSSSAIVVGAKTKSSTSVVFNGPGTLTGNFQFPTAKLTFEAFDLAKGTYWGVNIGGLNYVTSARELNVSLPDSTYYWTPLTTLSGPVAGSEYNSVSYSSYLYAPWTTTAIVVYAEYFQVDLTTGGASGGYVSPSGTNWLPAGSVEPLNAVNGTSVHFVSWSATTTSGTLPIVSTTQASTFATISGAGTITAKFA